MGYVSLGNKLVRNVFTNTHSSNVYLDDAISGWEISESVMSSYHPTLRDDGHPKAVVLAGGRHVRIVGNKYASTEPLLSVARSERLSLLPGL